MISTNWNKHVFLFHYRRFWISVICFCLDPAIRWLFNFLRMWIRWEGGTGNMRGIRRSTDSPAKFFYSVLFILVSRYVHSLTFYTTPVVRLFAPIFAITFRKKKGLQNELFYLWIPSCMVNTIEVGWVAGAKPPPSLVLHCTVASM